MSPRLTRTIYAVHKWCGLIIGVNLLILSVTAIYLLAYRGSWFLFNDTSTPWVPPALIDAQKRVPLQPVLDALSPTLTAAGLPLRMVSPARQDGDKNEFHFGPETEGGLSFSMEPYTGALRLDAGALPAGVTLGVAYDLKPPRAPRENVERPTLAAKIAEWMLTLHADLFMGNAGKFFVGVIGVLFFVGTVSGLIIYLPFMKSLGFGDLRKKRWRFLFADLHKLVGITTLMFNLIIAASGIGITLGVLALPWQEGRQLARFGDVAAAAELERPSIDAVIAAAQGSRAGWHIFEVLPPGDGHPGHYVVHGASQAGWQDITPLVGVVDVASPPHAEALPRPWWVSAIIIGAPMHYGNFGGMWMRFVYLAFTLATAALSISGFALYFMKRKGAKAVAA